jgi:hypothetical protein
LSAWNRQPRVMGASPRLLASILVALVACSAPKPAEQPRVAVRDSAGVRIVESAAPPPSDSAWSVDDAPVLRIGRAEGAPESQLFEVGPLARLGDGTVVVALASELRFFAADGTWVRTVGRKGEGPGEYRDIESLDRIRGDSLVVWDRGTRRVTWLARDGSFARDVRISQEQGNMVDAAAVLDDGRLVTARHLRILGQSTDYRRDSLSYALQPGQPSTESVPLARLGGQEWHLEAHGRAVTLMLLPFSRRALAEADRDRVYLAETDRPEIRVFAPEGTLTELLRLPWTAQTVSPPLLDSVADYDHLRAQAEAAERGYTLPERPADEYRESTRRLSRVPTLPALGAVIADGQGDLWVREYDPPWRAGTAASRWWVLGPDGTPRTRVSLPPGLDVRCIQGDRVLGVVTDDLGVEYVEEYRIRR